MFLVNSLFPDGYCGYAFCRPVILQSFK